MLFEHVEIDHAITYNALAHAIRNQAVWAVERLHEVSNLPLDFSNDGQYPAYCLPAEYGSIPAFSYYKTKNIPLYQCFTVSDTQQADILLIAIVHEQADFVIYLINTLHYDINANRQTLNYRAFARQCLPTVLSLFLPTLNSINMLSALSLNQRYTELLQPTLWQEEPKETKEAEKNKEDEAILEKTKELKN